MTNSLIILNILLILFFTKMQISFKKSKSNHLDQIRGLREVINNLANSNNKLNQKVSFAFYDKKQVKYIKL